MLNLAGYLYSCRDIRQNDRNRTVSVKYALQRCGFTGDGQEFTLLLYKYNWIAVDRYNGQRTWNEDEENAFRNAINSNYDGNEVNIFQALKTLQCFEYNIADIDGYELTYWLTQYEKAEYEKVKRCLSGLIGILSGHIISQMDEYKSAAWG